MKNSALFCKGMQAIIALTCIILRKSTFSINLSLTLYFRARNWVGWGSVPHKCCTQICFFHIRNCLLVTEKDFSAYREEERTSCLLEDDCFRDRGEHKNPKNRHFRLTRVVSTWIYDYTKTCSNFPDIVRFITLYKILEKNILAQTREILTLYFIFILSQNRFTMTPT